MSSKWDTGPRLAELPGFEVPLVSPALVDDPVAMAQLGVKPAKPEKTPRPRFGRKGPTAVRAKGRVFKRDGKMNSLEKRFALELDALLVAGKIARWDFEPERFRLADDTFYCPDFRILSHDGAVEFFEVKGFWDSATRVRFTVAAEQHPYCFVSALRPSKKKLALVKDRKVFAGWAFEVRGGESAVVAAFLAAGSGELFAGPDAETAP